MAGALATDRGRGTFGDSRGKRSIICVAGIVAAVALRVAVGGRETASSIPAGIVFAAALFGLAIAAGWRPAQPKIIAFTLGAAGGGALVAAWLLSHSSPGLHVAPVNAGILLWTPLVSLVAVAEEVALRGALFSALRAWSGDGSALIVTTLVFGLIHLPLYGIESLPLDLAAGLLLGGLRIVSGGVLAPATAHVIADLAGGWLL